MPNENVANPHTYTTLPTTEHRTLLPHHYQLCNPIQSIDGDAAGRRKFEGLRTCPFREHETSTAAAAVTSKWHCSYSPRTNTHHMITVYCFRPTFFFYFSGGFILCFLLLVLIFPHNNDDAKWCDCGRSVFVCIWARLTSLMCRPYQRCPSFK